MRIVIAACFCALVLWGCQPRTGNLEIVGQVSRNEHGAVAAYLEAGGDPNVENREGDPLLYIAAGAQGGLEVADLLIRAGADLQGKSAEGRTVLHNAVGWCNVEMVALLLAAGADPEALDGDGRTALDAVCKRPQDRRAAVLNLLMESGG